MASSWVTGHAALPCPTRMDLCNFSRQDLELELVPLGSGPGLVCSCVHSFALLRLFFFFFGCNKQKRNWNQNSWPTYLERAGTSLPEGQAMLLGLSPHLSSFQASDWICSCDRCVHSTGKVITALQALTLQGLAAPVQSTFFPVLEICALYPSSAKMTSKSIVTNGLS